MFISVLVRRLRPGKSYDDFVGPGIWAFSTDESVDGGRPEPA